ncbi:hypothetical protein BG004_006929, partial [Podila humilis]
ILNVHLVKNTVFTFCIDATLRAFDIPSRTLLHQVKLLDIQPGSTRQWSCMQGNMFLAGTNKKVYVWHMEHLESLVQQQNEQQIQAFQRQIPRPKSAMSASSDSSNLSGSNSVLDHCENHHPSPPQTPATSASPTSLYTMVSAPETPAVSIGAPSSCSSSGSSYFHSSDTRSPMALFLASDSLSTGTFDAVETRVQPHLTAVLNMTMDMWCGHVTRHEPPVLVLGSRSSSTKLVTLSLTKDIIDPSKIYKSNYAPLQVFPKPAPVQGMPGGHGRGIMCIDADASRLVVGCTGGTIHVMNMDPTAKAVRPLRANQTQVAIVTLPHLAPVCLENVRSVSPINMPLPLAIATPPIDSSVLQVPGTFSGLSSTPASPLAANSIVPRRPPAAYRTNSTHDVGPRFSLPTPDGSPMTPTMPHTLSGTTQPMSDPVRSSPHNDQPSHPPTYEDQQEVLVTDEDDEDAVREKRYLTAREQQLANSTYDESKSANVTTTAATNNITTSLGATRGSTNNTLKTESLGSFANKSASISSIRPRTISQSNATPKPFLPASRGSSLLSSSAALSTASSPIAAHSTPSVLSITQHSSSLSGFSKYIPSPPARIMMRRRASSSAWAHAKSRDGSNSTTVCGHVSSAASLIMRGRNKSDPDLLSSCRSSSSGSHRGSASGSNATCTTIGSKSVAAPSSPMPSSTSSVSTGMTPKSRAKSWSLPSSWNNPVRRSKNKTN